MSAPLDSQINDHFAVVNSLGRTVLIETIKMAAFYVSHSGSYAGNSRMLNMHIKEGRSCYLFVQGTGLQILINRFGLAYDADKIQDTFNYCVRKSA